MIFGIIGNVYINTYTGILNNEEKCFEKLGFIKVEKKNNIIKKDRLYKDTKIMSKIINNNLCLYILSFLCVQRGDKKR